MKFKNIRLNFTITNNMLNNLTRIAAAKEIIDHAFILPQWELKLRKEALILDAHHSTRIEGNTLTFEEVSKLAQGRKIMASRREKDEVLNYLSVLTSLEKYSKMKLASPLLKKIHKIVTQNTLEKPEYCGKY